MKALTFLFFLVALVALAVGCEYLSWSSHIEQNLIEQFIVPQFENYTSSEVAKLQFKGRRFLGAINLQAMMNYQNKYNGNK